MAIVMRNEGSKVNSRINVTPMVDVMLVLLIIFMVITPLLQPGPRVQLAQAANPLQLPDADKEDALLVAINREGQLFLGNEKISPADLTQKIRERIAGRTDRTVFVKADARSHYSAVVGVVDNVRSAGASELALLTERRRQ
ncbi:MAG TPA: biopolymer transporter ExbD [Verrucomicrobiae bacterium]|jgi:biopolymer transport protein TolR|nr:biopolymer transporter ExbD [Verrucomicrobiae bacterium]